MALDATCFLEIFLKDVFCVLNKKKKAAAADCYCFLALAASKSHKGRGVSPHRVQRDIKKGEMEMTNTAFDSRRSDLSARPPPAQAQYLYTNNGRSQHRSPLTAGNFLSLGVQQSCSVP